VLFSNPEVSALVRDQFVAAWESVRPVPIVEIDFGNGTKLKRTVNGNIATYLCTPEGRVLDVIPGLNSPEAYLDDLRHALNLYRATFARCADVEKILCGYHRENLTTPTVYEWVINDAAKARIERLIKMSLDMKQTAKGLHIVPGPYARPAADSKKWEVEQPVRALTAEDAAILAADTELNRKERKPLLHKILSEKIVTPAEITKRVYKEVLHCDLDDPYLGLVSSAFHGGAYEDR
jgi:hypothetical protein